MQYTRLTLVMDESSNAHELVSTLALPHTHTLSLFLSHSAREHQLLISTVCVRVVL
jgi:hypothetical protein